MRNTSVVCASSHISVMYKRAKKYAYKRSAYARRPAGSVVGFTKRVYAPIARPITNASAIVPRPSSEELGTYDVSTTAVATTTGVLTLLFVPTRTGNTYQDRHGDATVIKSINLNFTVKPGVTTVTNSYPQWVRCFLFWDNQPNGAVPAGALPLTALTINAMTDPQYSYRFTMIRNWRYQMGSSTNGMTGADITTLQGHFYKSGLNLISNFSGNAGTIADITTGALYLYVIGDTAAVSNENPVVTFVSRIKFSA